MSNSQEQLQHSRESGVESISAPLEQLEKNKSDQESSVELSPRDIESRAEKARIEALETAVSVEAGGKEKDSRNSGQPSIRRGKISKKIQEDSYKQTMKQVQNDLPPVSRFFSKLIHNKAIEKTSDAVGSTIARPNALLAGSFFSFTLTLFTYTVAKTIGYKLSGFETIAAFIAGWFVGIVYDYLKALITGKNS